MVLPNKKGSKHTVQRCFEPLKFLVRIISTEKLKYDIQLFGRLKSRQR